MIDLRKTLSAATDEQLLASHLAGDREAFAGLVRRHEGELHRFLHRFVGDAAAAEDVFQEALLTVHQAAGRFDPGKRFRPWLFTIAANKARDLLRSRARRQTVSTDQPSRLDAAITLLDALPSPSAGPAELAETAELRHRVRLVIDTLPDLSREVLSLAYLHQMPGKQMSRVLNAPLGTVKSRLHVATRQFAAAWEKAESDVSDVNRN